MNRSFHFFIILNLFFCISLTQFTRQASKALIAPEYYIDIDLPLQERYKQIIQDKYYQLNQFIDVLYGIHKFRFSMWLAKFIFYIIPLDIIKNYLGTQFLSQCMGMAKYSNRQLHEIVVYNYMYELGASKDFCTSIALTQNNNPTFNSKINLNLLARNLDYGFQKYLAQNTIKLNFYKNYQQNVLYTTVGHAGFVSSHTLFKFQNSLNIQYGLTLNERNSGGLLNTLGRILFARCQSVFQTTNRLLKTDTRTIQNIIELVSSTNSCARFYFIIHVKDGTKVLIEKDEGVGIHKVYIQRNKTNYSSSRPFYILQTNTDLDKPDPDGRRDQATQKIQAIIKQKGYVERSDIKRILLEAPNFNNMTLMTALIDVQSGEIETMIWKDNAVQEGDNAVQERDDERRRYRQKGNGKPNNQEMKNKRKHIQAVDAEGMNKLRQ